MVLMGDAAHSIVNHMAQGAATSMKDGVLLGCIILEVVRGVITIPEATQSTKDPDAEGMDQTASFFHGGRNLYVLR
jgi:2-polyprenyl-6-methoxyphenol hydroxylase-like FAD-dependent oxidoreductase